MESRVVRLSEREVELVQGGEGAGPLIVLESGLGDGWASWRPVWDELVERGRVLAYSRAGYDRSTPVDDRRDITAEARDLRGLLRALGEEPPFLIVGHSLGGLIGQVFAAENRQEVAGLVLVDAPPPDLIETLAWDQGEAGETYRAWAGELRGAMRLENLALTAPGGGHLRVEQLYGGPMIILSAWIGGGFRPEPYRRLRRRLATEHAARYPQAELRKVSCGHYIHHERPLAVVEAVDEVLGRIRFPGFADPSLTPS